VYVELNWPYWPPVHFALDVSSQISVLEVTFERRDVKVTCANLTGPEARRCPDSFYRQASRTKRVTRMLSKTEKVGQVTVLRPCDWLDRGR
jgi:hypothetical protein